MNTFLYELSVASFLQSIDGLQKVLVKGAEYAEANSENADDYLDIQLHDSMLPLRHQLLFARHHTLGCLEGMRRGEFSPPSSFDDYDYQGMQSMMASIVTELSAIEEQDINSMSDQVVLFKFEDMEIPFAASNFVLSFCLPNLYFHTATAYDILRQKGVALSKADYLGQMRIGV